MEVQWFKRDQEAVLNDLRRGVRPLMATTMSSGPLDELIALHDELGVFDALDQLPVARQREGIDDDLLFRTLAALPFLPEPGLDPSARLLFQEPAILLRLGWAPAQIQAGDNARHRHPEGRRAESLPCHPDTLRDAFRRAEAAAWLRVQEATVSPLYRRQPILFGTRFAPVLIALRSCQNGRATTETRETRGPAPEPLSGTADAAALAPIDRSIARRRHRTRPRRQSQALL